MKFNLTFSSQKYPVGTCDGVLGVLPVAGCEGPHGGQEGEEDGGGHQLEILRSHDLQRDVVSEESRHQQQAQQQRLET